jgi:hypothetical protein
MRRREEKMISLWHWILLEFDANGAGVDDRRQPLARKGAIK